MVLIVSAGVCAARLGAMTDTATVAPPLDHEADVAAASPAGMELDGAPEEASARSLRFSILISAIRCTLTYVILPFVTPFIGLAPGVGPAVGIPIAVVALWANIASIRRHWTSGHRWKWPVSVLNAGIIVLLVILLVLDVGQLL